MKKVLIAEDEPFIVESLRFVLSRAGFDVEAVGDGESALLKVREWAPDVLVLDLMLPGRNGFDVLKILNAEPFAEPVKEPMRPRVLMLTAKGQEQDRITANQLGVDSFMTKPFANRDVVDEVRRLIDL